jgi:hypothetical protein
MLFHLRIQKFVYRFGTRRRQAEATWQHPKKQLTVTFEQRFHSIQSKAISSSLRFNTIPVTRGHLVCRIIQ